MPLFRGIDSSNYTSSVALVDDCGKIIADIRRLLTVKQGERGLRQSDALFQHWNNIPELLSPLLREYRSEIKGVCASVKPRPAEGSYMPVFRAGEAIGRITADALGVPFSETSHQEGHIKAASVGNDVDFGKPVLCAHLSGGTLELVLVKDGKIEICGATKDISYGQLLDRTGVAMGFPFPAGKYIDEAALSFDPHGVKNPFCRINMTDEGLNLSGIETQIVRKRSGMDTGELSYFLMERISESFTEYASKLLKDHDCDTLLVTGGVASSGFLRKYCKDRGFGFYFGQPSLCSDNAVGPALLQGSLVK